MFRKKKKIVVLACAKTFLHIKLADIFQSKLPLLNQRFYFWIFDYATMITTLTIYRTHKTHNINGEFSYHYIEPQLCIMRCRNQTIFSETDFNTLQVVFFCMFTNIQNTYIESIQNKSVCSAESILFAEEVLVFNAKRQNWIVCVGVTIKMPACVLELCGRAQMFSIFAADSVCICSQ